MKFVTTQVMNATTPYLLETVWREASRPGLLVLPSSSTSYCYPLCCWLQLFSLSVCLSTAGRPPSALQVLLFFKTNTRLIVLLPFFCNRWGTKVVEQLHFGLYFRVYLILFYFHITYFKHPFHSVFCCCSNVTQFPYGLNTVFWF